MSKKDKKRQKNVQILLDKIFDEPFGKKREAKEKRNKKSKPPN
jgi:hypothetical protein|tara:strand:- start:39 stop:167 length:129 start_codon:yes stop_codon:yes gene_type:complete